MSQKSNLWEYYEKCENNIAKCDLCYTKIKSSENTTNLKCHLDAMHKQVLPKAKSEKQKEQELRAIPKEESSNTRDASSFVSIVNTVNEFLAEFDEDTSGATSSLSYLSAELFKKNKSIADSFNKIKSSAQGDKNY